MLKKWKIVYRAFVLVSVAMTISIAVAVATVIVNKHKCTEKLIIDTDAGVDDAVAILLVLEAQKNLGQCLYEVVAITCSYGNTNEKQVEMNVRKTLTVANRSDIAIYAGATRSLLHAYEEDSSFYFGKDGFGDYKFDDEILAKVDYSMPASVAMIELSKTHEGNLNILMLGPTTNVALAGSIDRGFFDRVKHFYVMGSSVAGVGNIRPGVECNFAADPESNYILLSSTNSSELSLFPWETAVNSKYSHEWRQNALNDNDSKAARFLNGIESQALKKPSYIPVDAMAATAMLLGDKFVKKSLKTYVEAVVDGAARGAVLVDYEGRIRQSNAEIIQSVHFEAYQRIFLCAFTKNCNDFQ